MILAASFFDIIQRPFGMLLKFLYDFTNSYGLALILFALLVKLVLMPATAKAKKSSMKMSRLSPQIKALQDKYADDPQRQNAELQALYKQEGVSIGGSCLWSFLPLLILIPLYTVVRQPIEYMLGETHEIAKAVTREMGFEPLSNGFAQLQAAAKIFTDPATYEAALLRHGANSATLAGLNFSFLGIDLGAIPRYDVFSKDFWNWPTIGGCVIPLLSAGSQLLSMVVSQKMNNSVVSDENGIYDKETAENSQSNQQSKIMMWVGPIMSLWIGFTIPCALSLYWFAQGIVTLASDVYLTRKYRTIYDAEDAVKLKRMKEQEAIEAEKERQRAERRAANPEGITTNTSKKKVQAAKQAEREAEKAAAAREYAAKKGEVVEEPVKPEKTAMSGITDRPYCKGRNYDPDRYKEK